MSHKLLFMGTPDFAVPSLRALIGAGYEVAAVVTQPDKAKGRSKELVPTPVKEEALRCNIPVLQPVRIRQEGFLEVLKVYQPDAIVVVAFGQILPREVLELPPYGCLNVHGSLLPAYRGAAPIQHALMDGNTETGATIMRMGEGLDDGDMIAKAVVPICDEDTGGSLFDKVADAGAELLVKTLPSVFDGTAVYEKQPKESTTAYAAMITKEMGLLDFSMSAEKLCLMIRGLAPWPSAYTRLDGKTLKIWRASASDRKPPETAACGAVLSAGPGGIEIACGCGILTLLEVQLEGRRRMPVDAFLRGFSLREGTILGV